MPAHSSTPDRRVPFDTSRIHAPLSQKQRDVNAREFKRAINGPPPVSKPRKVWISPWQRFNHERFIRARMTPEQLEAREALIGPLSALAPRGHHYTGDYQVPEKKPKQS